MTDLGRENRELRGQIMYYAHRLHAVESSFSWQMSQEIHGFICRIFPEGTRRWSWYVSLVSSLQRFVNSFDRVAGRKTEVSFDMLNSFVPLSQIRIRPLISIVVPVFNTEVRFLEKMFASVLGQTYKKWELVLVDDCSTNRSTIDCINKFIKEHGDERNIVLIRNNKNKKIAGSQNVGIKHSKGVYIAFLDHDDELSVHALSEVVYAIQTKDAEVIYTDEESIDKYGSLIGAYRKSDYSEDLLLAQNYFNHLTVIKKDILKKVGGVRLGYDGSQDHDLYLRAVEVVRPERIVHIPQVLYRWRHHRASFSGNTRKKKLAMAAGVQAIESALRRRGVQGVVSIDKKLCHYNVHRQLDVEPLVTIIIPFKNKFDLLKGCLDSIVKKTTYKNFEIMCIDNQSTDVRIDNYLVDMCARHSFISYSKYDDKFNFSKINNWAARKAKGEHLIFLNNDTVVISPDWIEQMLGHSLRNDVALVGALLLYPNNTVQHAGVAMGMGGAAGHIFLGLSPHGTYFNLARIARDVSIVTGACMMIKKDLFEDLGGFDENMAVAFNDVELCIRALKAGYRNIYTPHATLYHFESVSRGYENTPQKIERHNSEVQYLLDLHSDLIVGGDPHYREGIWG